MSSYQRAYRIVGFGSIGLILLIISIMLSRGLGVLGFVLPWVLVGIGFLIVEVVLELVIEALELREGHKSWRYERGMKRKTGYRDDWSNAGPVLDDEKPKRKRR